MAVGLTAILFQHDSIHQFRTAHSSKTSYLGCPITKSIEHTTNAKTGCSLGSGIDGRTHRPGTEKDLGNDQYFKSISKALRRPAYGKPLDRRRSPAAATRWKELWIDCKTGTETEATEADMKVEPKPDKTAYLKAGDVYAKFGRNRDAVDER